MRSTPNPLPDFIRQYKHPPYKNIYQICEEEERIFATESLYGDWDAELLILAQDVGPAGVFEDLRDSGHLRPFSHREFRPGFPNYDPSVGRGGADTNETVFRLAEHLSCSKLYGSALIGLCRPGEKYSGPLPDRTLIRPHCARVLRWVIDPVQMPNLKAVICLGVIADEYLLYATRDAPPLSRSPRLFHTPHPTAWREIGSYDAVLPAWREMARQMGWAFKEK